MKISTQLRAAGAILAVLAGGTAPITHGAANAAPPARMEVAEMTLPYPAYHRDRNPAWGHGHAPRHEDIVIRCESHDGHPHFCPIHLDRRAHVELARQLTEAPCHEGHSWGWNHDGIWVSRGCHAEFEIERHARARH